MLLPVFHFAEIVLTSSRRLCSTSPQHRRSLFALPAFTITKFKYCSSNTHSVQMSCVARRRYRYLSAFHFLFVLDCTQVAS